MAVHRHKASTVLVDVGTHETPVGGQSGPRIQGAYGDVMKCSVPAEHNMMLDYYPRLPVAAKRMPGNALGPRLVPLGPK